MVDFEVLTEQTPRVPFLDELERLVFNRRWNWQRWVQNPPQMLGIFIFLLVVAELTLQVRMVNEMGLGLSIVRQFVLMGAVLGGIELILAMITAQAAEICKTTGNLRHLFTFFNMGLVPLLIYLPVSLPSWFSGRGQSIRAVLLLLLLIKVLGNWREGIELVYKLSKMQSALVMYATTAVAVIAIVLSSYVILFNRIADFF